MVSATLLSLLVLMWLGLAEVSSQRFDNPEFDVDFGFEDQFRFRRWCRRWCRRSFHPRCRRCHRDFFLAAVENPDCGRAMVKVENDTCASIAERFEIIDGVKGLEALNPNLQCSDVIEPIAKGRLICVRKIKTGEVSKMPFCEKFHVATGGESCEDSAKSYSVAVDLAALNPEVNCEKLPAGEILCAKMHTAPICEEFYPVIKADETCDSIVAANQMKLVTLATLNPDLKCDKPLEIGHMLCLNLLVSELL